MENELEHKEERSSDSFSQPLLKQNETNAIVALVLGVLSVFTSCVGVGLVLAIISLVLCKKSKNIIALEPERYTGDTMLTIAKVAAIVGLVLNTIGLLYLIIVFGILGASMGFFYEALGESML